MVLIYPMSTVIYVACCGYHILTKQALAVTVTQPQHLIAERFKTVNLENHLDGKLSWTKLRNSPMGKTVTLKT